MTDDALAVGEITEGIEKERIITAVRVVVCSPGRNFVTLVVETRGGVVGIGDATLNGRELAVATYLEEHVCPNLVGRDAANIEDIWQFLYRGAYWRRGSVTMELIDVEFTGGSERPPADCR